ncbi:MAG: 3-hydroxyacyl-CoA dehydrogenase NAD-binding domain-containing protein, partial [Flavobacteriales bacterium]
MKEQKIRKVAILGSGVMGSRIACHFANIGLEVLLLDIVPDEPNEKEKAKGLSREDRVVRDRIANESLQNALKGDPSPIYSKSFAGRISTGNFEDDLEELGDYDWILEAIIEKLEIKQELFSKVEEHRRPGTVISTNTSGIPVHMISEGRSEDFKKHFCGTHFFNPPRYLQLLEIIPGPETDPELIEFLMSFGHRELGKKTVQCKDTPAFIGNRIGVYSIMSLFHLADEMGMTVNEVDKLTGPVLGRPKSATFRTCDVVGLDTLVHVADDLKKNCPEDEGNARFEVPDKIRKMVDEGMLGSKSGKGFYKKVKDEEGKSHIYELDLEGFEYQEKSKVSFPSLDKAMQAESLKEQVNALFQGDDRAAEFTRRSLLDLLQYASKRIPGIADRLHQVDDAIRAGFGWKAGPFELWDMIGVKEGIEKMKELDHEPADWVQKMLDNGVESFYKLEGGVRYYYDIEKGQYEKVPGSEELIVLSELSDEKVLWSNSEATVYDIGDGVINVAFHSKMNTIGGDVMKAVQQAIDHAEDNDDYVGVMIGNEGDNFSAGANVGMILMMAAEQDFDELDMAVRQFQRTTMRIRYSS